MSKPRSHTPSVVLGALALFACSTPGTPADTATSTQADTSTAADGSFSAQVWADNWFSMWIGDRLIIEDSVPLTTERSFNAETFEFEATPPFVMSFVLADFKQNDSGLEYIGARNQQMGDGGFIAQFRSGGKLVRVSDATWRCLVIHQAPLNKDCESSPTPEQDCEFVALEQPEGWKLADFDDSAWSTATIHSTAAVGPKDGYDEISWDETAELIWGADLESDNTILCRAWIE